MKSLTTFVMAGALAVAGVLAAETDIDVSKIPPASPKKDLTFEKDIKPIFDAACVQCHGAEKPKGKLRLDTLEGTVKGGISGQVLVPGDSAKSMIVHNIAYLGDEATFMPPLENKEKIEKLSDEQIGIVRAWIDQGASK